MIFVSFNPFVGSIREFYSEQVAVVGGGFKYGILNGLGVYARLEDARILTWIHKVAFNISNISKRSKILVVGGRPFESGRNVEIIDTKDDTFSCKNIDRFQIKLFGGSEGIIENGIPMVCGGGNGNAEIQSKCYKLDKRTWIETEPMMTPRQYASSVNLQGKIWVLGGSRQFLGNALKSTEMITEQSTKLSFELPTPMQG